VRGEVFKLLQNIAEKIDFSKKEIRGIMKSVKRGVSWGLSIEPEISTEYAGTKLRDYHLNPDTMLETEKRVAKIFYEEFGYGAPEIKAIGINPLFYSCACALGARIVFPEDDSPQIKGRVINDLKDIRKLKVKDVSIAGYIPKVLEKYEYLKKREKVTGIEPVFSLPAQSPLGTAIVLRGTNLFLDISTDPCAVKDLLEIITDTAIRLLKFEEEITGKKIESIGMDDDYGGLVSPEIYSEFNFPYMRRIYEKFGKKERFLHSETLGKGHLKYLSDLRITNYDAWPYHNLTVKDVKEKLPDTFFTWNFTVRELYSFTPKQIKEKFKRSVIDGAPGMNLDLCARRVPKENIKAFVEIARTI